MEAVVVCELLVYGRADCCCFHDVNRFSVALSHPFMPAKLFLQPHPNQMGTIFKLIVAGLERTKAADVLDRFTMTLSSAWLLFYYTGISKFHAILEEFLVFGFLIRWQLNSAC